MFSINVLFVLNFFLFFIQLLNASDSSGILVNEKFSHEFTHSLLIAPKLGPIVNSQTQRENSSFGIYCRLQEGSLPVFFEWFKDGKSLTNKHGAKYEIESGKKLSSLNIEKINREDVGNYSCQVKNIHGSDTLNVQLNVKGNYHLSFV